MRSISARIVRVVGERVVEVVDRRGDVVAASALRAGKVAAGERRRQALRNEFLRRDGEAGSGVAAANARPIAAGRRREADAMVHGDQATFMKFGMRCATG